MINTARTNDCRRTPGISSVCDWEYDQTKPKRTETKKNKKTIWGERKKKVWLNRVEKAVTTEAETVWRDRAEHYHTIDTCAIS